MRYTRSDLIPAMIADAVRAERERIKTPSRNAPAKTKAPRFPEGLMFANRGFVNINRS